MFGRLSPWKIIRGLIRTLFIALALFIAVFLLWRAYSHNHDPRDVSTLLADDALTQAYAEHGDELILYTQEQGTYTRAERNDGYFFLRQVVFIPQARQIQVVFRYNNSTIDALARDYALPEVPDRKEQLYDLSIVLKKDLTPDIADDFDEEGAYTLERYHPDKMESFTHNLYNYRRLIFNDVEIDEQTLAAFVDIYYVEDIDYDAPAYGTLCIWDFLSRDIPRKLTAADRRAILERFPD